MTAFGAIVSVTLRAILSRRRVLLTLALVALPILVGLLIRITGGRPDAAQILDIIAIRTVMPLIALIVGTSALGSEIEDGTAVFLLVKPLPRWLMAAAKLCVAAGLTAAFVVPPVVIAGLLIGGGGGEALGVTFGFALAALVGGTAYACAFTALGAVTSRALIAGLIYVLLWEGSLSGLLEGTRFLSIRQATLGLASAWTGQDTGDAALDPTLSAVVVAVVIAGAFAVTTLALQRFQLRGAE